MNLRRLTGIVLVILFGLLVQGCTSKSTPSKLILATTTETQDTGLVQKLNTEFEKETNIKVSVIAVDTGEVFNLGRNGDADVLLVSSPEDEQEFVKKGYGIDAKKVMDTDFIIVGPKKDPAKIKGLKNISTALKKIAAVKVSFVTRGDNSETNKKELAIWKKAGIKPAGDWYINAGQGMIETAKMASDKGAYTLIDKATYLMNKKDLKLAELIEGPKDLVRSYSVIAVNPKKFPRVSSDQATSFEDWITSNATQDLIGEFGKDKYGQALFSPAAGG